MRRGVHIAISLVMVLLLLKPFDCFSSGPFTQKAAACCKKGKCAPTPNSDDCCKNNVPGGRQLVTPTATDHSSPVLDLVMADVPSTTSEAFVTSLAVEVHPPPGSPPDFRLNLPLLI